jgi:ribosomal subunit interface protein
MLVRVSGKHMDVGQSLTEFIEKEITKSLNGYFSDAPDVHVTLSKSGHFFTTDLIVQVSRNFRVFSRAQEDDAYKSVTHSIQKLETQVLKYKSRIKDRKRHKDADLDAQEFSHYVITPQKQDTMEEKPTIIEETNLSISTLSVAEAVMRLELSDEALIVFRNSGTLELNLVYWRKDGHIGWVHLDK